MLDRARNGESFVVTKNGVQVAQIAPPPPPEANGKDVLAFLHAWEPDGEGFTDEIVEAVEVLAEPAQRDQDRLAWVDDYR